MRIFFRVAIIFLFALFLASCKQKAQNTSPIADCVVTPKVSPVEIYSDVEKNEKTNYELSVFTEPTQLSIIEQSGDLLKVKFSDGGSKKTGWISLKDVTLTKEIFDKTVNLAIDGDENAKILFEHDLNTFQTKRLLSAFLRFLSASATNCSSLILTTAKTSLYLWFCQNSKILQAWLQTRRPLFIF